MPAPGSCRVCSHPARARIEELIATGASGRAIAREIGLPESTIRVHRSRCKRKKRPSPAMIADVPAAAGLALPAVELQPDDPQATLLAELQAVHRKALSAYDRAVEAHDDRTIALLVQQLRNNLKAQSDIIAKARKDDLPPAERLAANPEWLAFQRVLLPLMDRHPEIKAEVIEALEAYVSQESPSS